MAREGASTESKIQTAVWQMEMGSGKQIIQWALVALLAVALGLIYSASQFRGLDKRESMDMAQVARNIAHGQGFTTYVIRPLSLWQLKTHTASRDAKLMNHPDIANPPLYPYALAALFKLLPEKVFQYDAADRIYAPERWVILLFNQFCLLLTFLIVYLWAGQLFDRRVAVMAGVLMIFSDTLWAYGISGLPTNLLMLLVLLSLYFLYLADRRANPPPPAEGEAAAPAPSAGGITVLVALSAVLLGLSFLTRYLAGFLIVPMAYYASRAMRGRGGLTWAGVYVAIFLVVIAPWLVRNLRVSGSMLGTAKYELVDRTAAFRGDALQRSFHPDFKEAYSIKGLASKFLTGARGQLTNSLKQIGSDFLVFFFVVGLMYRFRRRDTVQLRGVVVGCLLAAMFGLALIGHKPELIGANVYGADLLVLFLPVVAIYGVAFFYLLLDNIPFKIRLTRGVAIGAFALLNVAPIIFTLLPPRRGLYPYPPYFPPVTHLVAGFFEKDDLASSDMPWAMAWNGDRRTVWLPMSVEEFYEIHDFVAPKGFAFMMLTPYMLDQRQQTEVLHGEYKGWSQLLRGQIPPNFPLKAFSPLPPENDQLILADRARWTEKEMKVPSVTGEEKKEEKPATLEGTNSPPAETTPPAEPAPAAN